MQNRKLLAIIICCALMACDNSNMQPKVKSAAIAPPALLVDARPVDSAVADLYVTHYVVIADTGSNYGKLHAKMSAVAALNHSIVDSMERHWNSALQKIVLMPTAADTMYRGEYIPRRYVGNELSIEYLNFYFSQANSQTMAVVAGIYATEREAIDAMEKCEACNFVFAVKSKLYQGCIH